MTMEQGTVASSGGRPIKYVTLRDGRRLSYTEYGDPQGSPVLYSHGHPGSRLDPELFEEKMAVLAGVHIIAPDRPGIGVSDFLRGRKMTDWPADAACLMDELGLERFAVAGVSGGGPFAAVTAWAMPERVSRLLLLSSVGRFDLPGATRGMGPGLLYFRMGHYLPWLVKLQLGLMAKGVNSDPARMTAQVKMSLPTADLTAMEKPGIVNSFLSTMAEFLRRGPAGPAWESGMYMRPWGFPTQEIQVPTFLWHGEEDRNAPVEMGRNLANSIPGCSTRIMAGEGHFSLLINHQAEILQAMTG